MAVIEFLNEQEVAELLTFEELIPIIERALIRYSSGQVLQPVRQFVDVIEHGGFFGLMPAVSADMGVKLVTFYPRNAEKGKYTHHALILLFDAESGEPISVIDGRLITEMRTAATSAVATKILSSEDARTLAILGSGVQAHSHWEAMTRIRDFREIRVWSRDGSRAKRFAEEIGADSVETAEDAVRGADVVVTATASKAPILNGTWLKDGAHVNAIGWNGVDARELDDKAMSNFVFVESRVAALDQAGNVRGSGCQITGEIGEVLSGKINISRDNTTIFDSVGMAIEDIAAAGLVMAKSRAGKSL